MDYMYDFAPKIKREWLMCAKNEKVKSNTEFDAQKGAKLNSCTYQFLYISE